MTPEALRWQSRLREALNKAGLGSIEVSATEGNDAWWFDMCQDDPSCEKVMLSVVIDTNPSDSSWSIVCKKEDPRQGFGRLQPDTNLDELVQRAFP